MTLAAPRPLLPLLLLVVVQGARGGRALAPPVKLSCTFSRCSLSSPCTVGTCNNGYCCTSLVAKHRSSRSSRSNLTLSSRPVPPPPFGAAADDWEHLPYEGRRDGGYESNSPWDTIRPVDSRGSGDLMSVVEYPSAELCTGGFSSTIKCDRYASCPPGLICDVKSGLCCPMLMSLGESRNTGVNSAAAAAMQRRNFHHHPARFGGSLASYGGYTPAASTSPSAYWQRNMQYMPRFGSNYLAGDDDNYPRLPMKPRRQMGAYPCANCDGNGQQYYPSFNSDNSVTGGNGGCSDGSNGNGLCQNGRCGNGYSCNRNNVCCERVIPATVCSDGTQAAGACVNGQCGFSFTCNQGLCCSNTSLTPRCLDGTAAIGACIGGKCGDGFTCTTGSVCCPSTLSTCPAGMSAIGPCVNGVCPTGYLCLNNQCCGPPAAANSTNLLTTCSQLDSNGPCAADGTCAEPGYSCDLSNQWCCPNLVGDAVGPCIRSEGGSRLCPDGYACSGPEGGQCYKLDTGTCSPHEQFGPCAATEPRCPPGYQCIGGFCCNENSAYRRRRRSALLAR